MIARCAAAAAIRRPADVLETVEKALVKALQTNPDDRFATAIDLGNALAGTDALRRPFGKLKERFSYVGGSRVRSAGIR